MSSVIWWIRRGLRLHDNPTLRQALETGLPVLPVFILDPALQKPTEHRRQNFLFSGLHALNQSLLQHGVPEKYIHEPSQMNLIEQQKFGCLIGKVYPLPVVDRKMSRQRTLDAYQFSKHYSLEARIRKDLIQSFNKSIY